MESRVKFFGHPIHPVLVVLPVGLFTATVVFDVIYMLTGNPDLPIVAFYCIAVGVIGGLLAAVFGFTDWLGLPPDTRAKRIGLWHGIGNFTIVVLFAASWFLRRGAANFIPDTSALVLSFLGILMALVTAWIGGELVYRLGVAVDPGANVNAPSSLTSPAAPAKAKQSPRPR